MSTADITTILGNIGLSLTSVQTLVSGAGYLLGLMFVISGLYKFTKIKKHAQEHVSVPLALIFGGAVLIYLPSSIAVVSTTFFGTSSVLQYQKYSPYNIYSSMRVIIQTAGLIWFVIGTGLMVSAAEPGKQNGPKGLFFVIAGVLAMNFDYTVASINGIFAWFINLTIKIL